jgi:hypothetical protein
VQSFPHLLIFVVYTECTSSATTANNLSLVCYSVDILKGSVGCKFRYLRSRVKPSLGSVKMANMADKTGFLNNRYMHVRHYYAATPSIFMTSKQVT